MKQGETIPRIVIAAPSSGSGKTMITCALLEALKERGESPISYKCGPDYIDPLFHTVTLEIPSNNLDLFFVPESDLRQLFCRNYQEHNRSIAVIEGVMGLYDGIGGLSLEASTYHVARCLQAPIVLVLYAHGMGGSLLALLSGFLQYDTAGLIRGVILNQVSRAFYEQLKPKIEETFPVKVLGYFPKMDAVRIESRYLGLHLPAELSQIKQDLKSAAKQFRQTVDLDAVLQIAQDAAPLQEQTRISALPKKNKSSKPILAVARDEVFCFYYEENLRLLREAGLQLQFFSPLWDEALPQGTCGILLGGGYPELQAERLGKNTAMRKAIREAIDAGIPSVVECGGFLYLHEWICEEPMLGVVPGAVQKKNRLVRFGYIELEEKEPLFLGGKPIRGHEFHYFDSPHNGTDCVATKPSTHTSWECMHIGKNHWWGFPHLYYPSNPAFVTYFAQQVKAKQQEQFMRKGGSYDNGTYD